MTLLLVNIFLNLIMLAVLWHLGKGIELELKRLERVEDSGYNGEEKTLKPRAGFKILKDRIVHFIPEDEVKRTPEEENKEIPGMFGGMVSENEAVDIGRIIRQGLF